MPKGTVERGKHSASLIPGGIVPDDVDVFEKAIREQAVLAIEEARRDHLPR
ncbi:MAG: hypothetical protein IPM83_16210 [Ignavibacteria bacterium]|nr:hypothetical protein [Ignavibacteria bacterium]